MMSRGRRRGYSPTLDPLDARWLPSGGVSATLSHAVLSVQGTSPSAPIEVDIVTGAPGFAAGRSVVVPGVAQFPAFQVRKINITGVLGEAITVDPPAHRLRIPVSVNNNGVPPTPPAAPTAPAAPPSATAPSPVQATMSPLEQQVVDLTNQARAQNGLPPLQVNPDLVAAAQVQSANMAQLNELEHTIRALPFPPCRPAPRRPAITTPGSAKTSPSTTPMPPPWSMHG
jgi:hypothetical protein